MNDKPTLIDTNIFVYAYDSTQRKKHRIAKEIVRKKWIEGGVVTLQNLQEFFIVITRKVKNKISVYEAKEVIEGFILSPKWTILEPSVLSFLGGA